MQPTRDSERREEEKRKRRRRNMFEGLLQPMHLMIIAGIALLVLGPKKLPELGKGIGESIRGFKTAMAAKDEEPEPKAEESAKTAH
jgi:sec-independent protein translocase protein TatA